MRKIVSLLLCVCIMASLVTSAGINLVTAEEKSIYDINPNELVNLDELSGWASVSGEGVTTTTGGLYGDVYYVNNKDELEVVAWGRYPAIIIIEGMIDLRGYLYVGSNKTIVGADENAGVIGDIVIENQNNVIISNLNIQGVWPATRPEDGIAIRNSHHVWVDHVNIWDAKDGNLDITSGADYVTVSWCKFWYTDSNHDHRRNTLIGSGTGHDYEDMGKLNVTIHHCWFADKIYERQPRLLYGKGHIYNNYYTNKDALYCIEVGTYAAGLIENNYFDGVNSPHEFYAPGVSPASIVARDNVYNNTTGNIESGYVYGATGIRVPYFDNPPYEYYLDNAEDIPQIVMENVGPRNLVEEGTFSTEAPLITPAPEKEKEIVPIVTTAPYLSDNPITYDKESNTYTYNGQNSDGSNGALTLPNPFAGFDLSETAALDSNKHPVWKNGVTLAYELYIPEEVFDVPVFNFNLYNSRQMSSENLMDYTLCKAFDPEAKGYSLGEATTYYNLSGEPVTVLSGSGRNAKYNPDYPEEGAYSISSKGTIPAYPEGSSPDEPWNFVFLKYLGEGKYKTHSVKFDEEGGENSELEEVLVDGSLSLYASASVGYMRDNKFGKSLNPNTDSYGYGTAIDYGSEYHYSGNGSYPTNWEGLDVPTMFLRGQWHYVVTVIQNDGITTYIDGIEMNKTYLNYFGFDLVDKDNYYDYILAKGFAFNNGYGPKLRYITTTPDSLHKYNRTMLDMVTDKDTVLSIGGMGCSAFNFAQDWMMTDSGVKVRNIKAYPAAIASDCIYSDRLVSYVSGHSIQGDELVEIAADATPTPVPTPTVTPEPTVVVTNTPRPTATPFELLFGDVDVNGTVNAVDALLILKYAAVMIELDEFQIYLGDLNEDDILNAQDALEVLKIAAKLK